MKNHATIERRFERYGRYGWWPYVAELLVGEQHKLKTVRLVSGSDQEYALWLEVFWPEVIFQLCGHIERLMGTEGERFIYGVEDAVVNLHNFVAPSTPEGEALRAMLDARAHRS